MTIIRCLHSCTYSEYTTRVIQDISSSEMLLISKQKMPLSIHVHTRRPLIRFLSLVKHQPFAREICGIVEVSYSNARPGIRPTRVRDPLGPRIFSCKCGYLFFCTSNAEQWRSNSFSPESRIEIVGINAKAPLRSREYKHFLNGG